MFGRWLPGTPGWGRGLAVFGGGGGGAAAAAAAAAAAFGSLLLEEVESVEFFLPSLRWEETERERARDSG